MLEVPRETGAEGGAQVRREFLRKAVPGGGWWCPLLADVGSLTGPPAPSEPFWGPVQSLRPLL